MPMSDTVLPTYEEIIEAFTNPKKLYSGSEILNKHCPVPEDRGLYGAWFKEVPSCIRTDGCVVKDGLTLLYVGNSTQSENSKKDRTLRKRIITHFSGKVGSSTLRKSLSVLLMKQINWKMSSDGKKFILPTCDEECLSDWMEENAFFAWVKHDTPWTIKSEVIKRLPVRLNDHHNDHSFRDDLRRKLNEARKNAKAI